MLNHCPTLNKGEKGKRTQENNKDEDSMSG